VHKPRVLAKLQARQMSWALSVRHFVPRREAPGNALALGAGSQIAERPHTSHRGIHTESRPSSMSTKHSCEAARNFVLLTRVTNGVTTEAMLRLRVCIAKQTLRLHENSAARRVLRPCKGQRQRDTVEDAHEGAARRV
jgi:hypothetical protein